MHQGIYQELKKVARAKDITNYTARGRMIGLDMENPADKKEWIERIANLYHINKERIRILI